LGAYAYAAFLLPPEVSPSSFPFFGRADLENNSTRCRLFSFPLPLCWVPACINGGSFLSLPRDRAGPTVWSATFPSPSPMKDGGPRGGSRDIAIPSFSFFSGPSYEKSRPRPEKTSPFLSPVTVGGANATYQPFFFPSPPPSFFFFPGGRIEIAFRETAAPLFPFSLLLQKKSANKS